MVNGGIGHTTEVRFKIDLNPRCKIIGDGNEADCVEKLDKLGSQIFGVTQNVLYSFVNFIPKFVYDSV